MQERLFRSIEDEPRNHLPNPCVAKSIQVFSSHSILCRYHVTRTFGFCSPHFHLFFLLPFLHAAIFKMKACQSACVGIVPICVCGKRPNRCGVYETCHSAIFMRISRFPLLRLMLKKWYLMQFHRVPRMGKKLPTCVRISI